MSPHKAAPAATGDGYLPLRALAEYSGLSVRTLRDHLVHPLRPLPSYRVGGKLLVKRSEYDAWAAQFRVEPRTIDLSALADDIMNGLR